MATKYFYEFTPSFKLNLSKYNLIKTQIFNYLQHIQNQKVENINQRLFRNDHRFQKSKILSVYAVNYFLSLIKILCLGLVHLHPA